MTILISLLTTILVSHPLWLHLGISLCVLPFLRMDVSAGMLHTRPGALCSSSLFHQASTIGPCAHLHAPSLQGEYTTVPSAPPSHYATECRALSCSSATRLYVATHSHGLHVFTARAYFRYTLIGGSRQIKHLTFSA
ncbi:hypothetical protein [Porphyromonas pogonae]|uniref:hypothetical protein n=1 Tax=Porphyromonas pogonae TaxID=867595 RepID=UPI002E77E5F0|nr:hypothetical protein [Porphyromonas pogonae]